MSLYVLAMGHGHGHGVSAVSASQKQLKRLGWAFGVLLVFLVVEVIVGLATSSLALLSDAGHMLTDVLGIGMALAAITAARTSAKKARGGGSSRTFGLYRLEVLAALANAVLLLGVAGFILVEAVGRLADPPEIAAGPVMIAAAAGLAANLVAFALLRPAASESINMRGAYLEVLADTIASIGVLLGTATSLFFGWTLADPIVAVAIAVFVVPRTLRLAGQALRILVQQAPADLDIGELTDRLRAVPGVAEVHDLHVWTLTSGMEVLAAHLTVDAETRTDDVLASAQRMLAERYEIEHATLQVESTTSAVRCQELTW
ncbi:cobalt-zinc-cadmium efflux system protein [Actinoalloteichus hymeniacidonis]|nr:cobalt-zinc-cadmium efflux system protein [Actinoalloteichus hymeniacidonis]